MRDREGGNAGEAPPTAYKYAVSDTYGSLTA